MLYPKTENLLARGEDGVVLPQLRRPEFELVRSWHVTEKVDGMNIRIRLGERGELDVYGRSDNAQIPGRLLARIQERLLQWPDRFGPIDRPFWLFGEGYGPGIQRGAAYMDTAADPDFVLFDVAYSDVYGPVWFKFDDVYDVGQTLGLPVVPVLGNYASLNTAMTLAHGESIQAIRNRNEFALDLPQREGVILTTQPPLLDRFGSRIKAKVKVKDLEAAGGLDDLLAGLYRL